MNCDSEDDDYDGPAQQADNLPAAPEPAPASTACTEDDFLLGLVGNAPSIHAPPTVSGGVDIDNDYDSEDEED